MKLDKPYMYKVEKGFTNQYVNVFTNFAPISLLP